MKGEGEDLAQQKVELVSLAAYQRQNASRAGAHRLSQHLGDMAESLRAFILKAEVIKLYRNFWRTVKEAPPHTRGV